MGHTFAFGFAVRGSGLPCVGRQK